MQRRGGWCFGRGHRGGSALGGLGVGEGGALEGSAVFWGRGTGGSVGFEVGAW